MSAKVTQENRGLIIHGSLMCGNVRTVDDSGRNPARLKDSQSSTFPPRLCARFWAKVDRKSASECWPWLASFRGDYGYIRITGKGEQAHRIAWALANGRSIPAGLLIRHSCDNPACCNPQHLLLGTQAQNVLDAIERGRHVNPNWRLRKRVRNQHSQHHYERRTA